MLIPNRKLKYYESHFFEDAIKKGYDYLEKQKNKDLTIGIILVGCAAIGLSLLVL